MNEAIISIKHWLLAIWRASATETRVCDIEQREKSAPRVLDLALQIEKSAFMRVGDVEQKQSEMLLEMHTGLNSANARINAQESHTDSCELVKHFDDRLKALENGVPRVISAAIRSNSTTRKPQTQEAIKAGRGTYSP